MINECWNWKQTKQAKARKQTLMAQARQADPAIKNETEFNAFEWSWMN